MLIRLLIIAAFSSVIFPFPVRGLSGTEVYLHAQLVTLRGRVIAEGNAVPSVTVVARNVQTNFSKTTTTDDQGFYRFINLPPGRYAVEVMFAGFNPMIGQIEVAVDKNSGLNFHIGEGVFLTGIVEGKVTDEAKKGVADARVTIVEKETNLTQVVTTDAEGNYLITDLSPGKYKIAVEAPGFKATSDKEVKVKEEVTKTQNFRLKN